MVCALTLLGVTLQYRSVLEAGACVCVFVSPMGGVSGQKAIEVSCQPFPLELGISSGVDKLWLQWGFTVAIKAEWSAQAIIPSLHQILQSVVVLGKEGLGVPGFVGIPVG